MAETKRKSQAQKAASAAKQKKSSGKTTKKNNHTKKDPVKQSEEQKLNIPLRYTCAALCLILFVLFLVILLNSEGAVTKLFYDGILAIFGHVAYYVSIPALLYLFFIQAFSGKRPVLMRSICLGSFVVICGMFQEMVVLTGTDVKHIASFGELWNGGISWRSSALRRVPQRTREPNSSFW